MHPLNLLNTYTIHQFNSCCNVSWIPDSLMPKTRSFTRLPKWTMTSDIYRYTTTNSSVISKVKLAKTISSYHWKVRNHKRFPQAIPRKSSLSRCPPRTTRSCPDRWTTPSDYGICEVRPAGESCKSARGESPSAASTRRVSFSPSEFSLRW